MQAECIATLIPHLIMDSVGNLLSTAVHWLLSSSCLRGEVPALQSWSSKWVTVKGSVVAFSGGGKPGREERSGCWGPILESQIKAVGAGSHPD